MPFDFICIVKDSRHEVTTADFLIWNLIKSVFENDIKIVIVFNLQTIILITKKNLLVYTTNTLLTYCLYHLITNLVYQTKNLQIIWLLNLTKKLIHQKR